MKKHEQTTLVLDGFEGPIDFLLHLVKKSEIDIYEIPLKKIIEQFVGFIDSFEEDHLDDGAEFINDTAALMWIKSKTLLPKHEQIESVEESDPDPKFDIIHQLVEYCRFRDAGKALSSIEHEQRSFFVRGAENTIPSIPLGIEHLSIDDIAVFFKDALKKTNVEIGQINEDVWRVSDKIKFIRDDLKSREKIMLIELFSSGKSRMELIVTFLAILELMKMGLACVVREVDSGQVIVVKGIQNGQGN